MRRLSSIIAMLIVAISALAQSPHGDELKIKCADCHNPNGWKMIEGTYKFSHDKTDFPLVGQHQSVNCISCHKDLVFSKAKPECVSCHTDVHEQTVGNDCARCHTPQTWLVASKTQLHEQSRFPLLGAHAMADCFECHESASLLRFDPLGINCYDCHKENYEQAKEPDHVAGAFSTECDNCHAMSAFEWKGSGISHLFFLLTEGHAIGDCYSCHVQGQAYNSIDPICSNCHLSDYQATTNPNHQVSGFPTECNQCHNLSPGWKPAQMGNHDADYFPIYSGKHEGEWTNCTDCHTNAGNYGSFSCIDCHEHNQSDMNSKHGDVGGYQYNSNACFECHPSGSGEGSFNHSTSNFPLTGAHLSTACSQCHSNGYTGTSTACESCHLADFNQTSNPKHVELNLAKTCADCHTTAPGWTPATMNNHNDFYGLNGAHATTDCFACHEGNYNTTNNLCFNCHTDDYNQTTNPPHASSQFSTECQTCHTEVAWTPATFDHDNQYFPIYSGKHNGEWTNCNECHTTPNNFTLFSCIDCHDHDKPTADGQHNGIGGYQYNSNACFECHPNGEGDGFNHSTSNFPLTGAHLNVDCAGCHANGYSGTSTVCFDCHTTDFNQSANPNHQQLGIGNTCETCHTTVAGWAPATFPTHNNYYVLAGAHMSITNNCADCHNGNYNSTPNTCIGCHQSDYNQTTNPPHATQQYSTNCLECHTQSVWTPSTFDHDVQYFPIYSGEHRNEWNTCSQCHTNPTNYAVFSCIDCHEHNQSSMNSEHNGVNGYQWNSNACLNCHPTGGGGDKGMDKGFIKEN